MNDKHSPPARSEVIGPTPAASGQDWAIWLQRTHGAQESRPLAAPVEQAEATWTALTHVAQREGFTIERANCADAEGFTTFRNRRIRIRRDATPVQAVTALAHQLGHVLLHAQIAALEPSGTLACTGIRKVEADAVAFLAADYAGVDTTGITFPHVSSWAGTDARAHPATTIETVTNRIIDATAVITAHLDAIGISARQLPAPARAVSRGIADQIAGPQPKEGEHTGIHETAALFFHSQMPGSWVPGYLAWRGLSPAVQEQWHTGYAPTAWDALTGHLRAAGYADTLIEAAGLARRSRQGTLIDTFRDRAMLPIRSTDGTIAAFIGRATDQSGPGTPKYLNSPATSVYRKSEILFGLSEARNALAKGARPVIVEGPLDAIAVTTAGQGKYVGVAPCGTALTAHQATALARLADLRRTGVMVAFDSDQAGRHAAVRVYHLLVPHTDKLAAATIPAGQDPAQILADSGSAALADILASHTWPLPDLVINTEVARWCRWLRYPEGQIHALRATAPLIAAMPPAHIARQVARLAAILRLDHGLVTEAVTDALTTLVAGPAASFRDGAAARQVISGAPPPTASRTAGCGSPHSAEQAVAEQQAAAIVSPPACGSRSRAGQPQLASRRVRG